MYFVFRSLAAFIVLLTATTALASEKCHPLEGFFSSEPAAQCSSPVGLCTVGELRGKLRGTYEFTMAQVIGSNDATVPTINFYTGTSVVELRGGDLLGTDTGAIDLNPFGPGTFVSMITFIDGSGDYQGATGYLQLKGKLDFSTGGASGKFSGRLCR